MIRHLTDRQFVAIVEQFHGRRGSIAQVLQVLGIVADEESVAMELWAGGFKQCPRCATWHDDLWHSRCARCRWWQQYGYGDEDDARGEHPL